MVKGKLAILSDLLSLLESLPLATVAGSRAAAYYTHHLLFP